MIALNKISKTYNKGAVRAANEVSFAVGKGELFGLIGPDGAGKTSIFRVLTTLLLPDSGTASVNGFDVVKDYKKIRKNVGYMPGKFSLYQDLSVEENLSFFAAVFNTAIAENYHLIRDVYVQLEPFKDRLAGKLSGGMKQKLALCCALIHRPTVLFLDEPTTGVDVVSRREFWEMLKRLKQQGITILVSTPYMDEATRCERIALMQSGNILSVDTPGNIAKKFPEKLFAVKADNMGKLLDGLRNTRFVKTCNAFGSHHHVTMDNGGLTMDNLKRQLIESGHKKVEINEITPSIEDCFIHLLDKSPNGRSTMKNKFNGTL